MGQRGILKVPQRSPIIIIRNPENLGLLLRDLCLLERIVHLVGPGFS
jgi:hypothetical protein